MELRMKNNYHHFTLLFGRFAIGDNEAKLLAYADDMTAL